LIKELEGRKFIQASRYGKYFHMFFRKKNQIELKKLIILSVAPLPEATKRPANGPILAVSTQFEVS